VTTPFGLLALNCRAVRAVKYACDSGKTTHPDRSQPDDLADNLTSDLVLI